MQKCTGFVIALLISHWLFAQARYDLVIDEIMADPSPAVGLPEYEWVEIRNASHTAIDLHNWRIADASGQSGPLPAFILLPDSVVVICGVAALQALSNYGAALSASSFPSLGNDEDQLLLKSPDGRIIHAVSYTDAWYKNDVKKLGGWTLEMIDTRNPCSGYSNWCASASSNGGTPCRKNAVDAINKDTTAPVLLNAYTNNDSTVILAFDEPLDSSRVSAIHNYNIRSGPAIINALVMPPRLDQVQLKLQQPLSAYTVYTLLASNACDCQENTAIADSIRIGKPEIATHADLVINEILFNPRPNAYDFVELYNNSNKIIDAAGVSIASRNGTGNLSPPKTISNTHRYIFPGDYIAITEDPVNLALHYFLKYPGNIISIPVLPSLPDESGDVLVLNNQGLVIDEVDYNEAWHFKLLNNREGVSLERVNAGNGSNDPGNWHSAASTAGYGTPGYKNSQSMPAVTSNNTVTISPAVFSPDNDGHDDIAVIHCNISSPGYIANISIFDAAGRMVNPLVRNASIGSAAYWNWDGLDAAGRPLPTGTYIIVTQLFNLQGKKEIHKTGVVLVKRQL